VGEQGGVAPCQGDRQGLKAQADAVDGEKAAVPGFFGGQVQDGGGRIVESVARAQGGGAAGDEEAVDEGEAALDLECVRVCGEREGGGSFGVADGRGGE
jgi:hypothetical protein